jgi:glycosyltransferase involved in cell wall biosynthesis
MSGGKPDGERQAGFSKALREFIEEAPIERGPIVEFVAAAAASLAPGLTVLDIGAGGAPYRELFAHVDYVTVDRAESLHGDADAFDIVADVESVPLDDGSADAILCTQVLEHVPRPAGALAEFHRLLVGGGRLFLTAPLTWEEHERPHDYFRYTRSGLEHLLREAGFAEVEISGYTDCFSTLAQLTRNARWSLAAEENPVASRRKAFERLDAIADELLELHTFDSRHAFPLGHRVVARKASGQATSRRRSAAMQRARAQPVPILYLAPWIDLGGSDKGTIDWFRHVDREQWVPSIITTQPSANRWLREVEPYASEVWALPDLMPGSDFPGFILGFIETRGIELVHIMNSRLGYDLIPDMGALQRPPAVVVQLHAEEHDRSGYVRYVASRYGNLIDAFSVTSEQLAEAMLDYDIPRSRLCVIHTGVDAVGEFNPANVTPLRDNGAGSVPRILWPGRLVAQKDPLLTLEVVRALVDRGVRFTLDVVGDGDLKDVTVGRARELGLERVIDWHPPSREMPRWYRTADLILMTSVFEGVPYVVYEALAMGVPVVAPSLPGNVELMGDAGGVLVDPRDDVRGYADAIEWLLRDSEARRGLGRAARQRMLEEFSLERMAREHGALYRDLLSRRRSLEAARDETDDAPPEPAEPIRLERTPPPERTVAAIVPCYRHGRFLLEAIDSLRTQTLPPTRIVVVDDASEDPETQAALTEVETDPTVTVIRLPVNGGPSVARNRGLAEVRENYVIPLDADDLLAPTAIESLVEQLERAPASVGFVYPKVRHFGNRNDFYDPPDYNLHVLLTGNYCVAASLFDARLFGAGIRYPEAIRVGHEDWDLILQMAERGVYGLAADEAVFWYRKSGFSRIDSGEHEADSFSKLIEKRHPQLYGPLRSKIKAEWAPALSLVLAAGCDGADGAWPANIGQLLGEQSCDDFEVVLVGDDPGLLRPLNERRVKPAPSLEDGVSRARGRFVALVAVSALPGLQRRTFVEHLLRLFWSNFELRNFLIADVPNGEGPRMRPIDADECRRSTICAAAWRRAIDEHEAVDLDSSPIPLDAFMLRWQQRGSLAWRAL